MQKGFIIFLILLLAGLAAGEHQPKTEKDQETAPQNPNPEGNQSESAAKKALSSLIELKKLDPNWGEDAKNTKLAGEVLEGLVGLSDEEKKKFFDENPNFTNDVKEVIEKLRNAVMVSKTSTRLDGEFREDLNKQLDYLVEFLKMGTSQKPDSETERYLREVAHVRAVAKEWREKLEEASKATDRDTKIKLLAELKEIEKKMLSSKDLSPEWKEKWTKKFEKSAQARINLERELRPNTAQENNNSNLNARSERLQNLLSEQNANLSPTDRARLERAIADLRGQFQIPSSNGNQQPQQTSEQSAEKPNSGNNSENRRTSSSGSQAGSSVGSDSSATCIACGGKKNEGPSHSQGGTASPTGGLVGSSARAGGAIGSAGNFSSGVNSGGGANSTNRGPASQQPMPNFQTPMSQIPTGTANSGAGIEKGNPSEAQSLANKNQPTTINNFFGGGGSNNLPTPGSQGNQGASTGEFSKTKYEEKSPSSKREITSGIAAGGTNTNSGLSGSNPSPSDNSSTALETSGTNSTPDLNPVKKTGKVSPYQWGLAQTDSSSSTDGPSLPEVKAGANEKTFAQNKVLSEKSYNQVDTLLRGNLPQIRSRGLTDSKGNSGSSDLGNFNLESAGGGLGTDKRRSPASFNRAKNLNRKPTQLAASGSSAGTSSSLSSRGFMNTVKSFGKSVIKSIASFFGLK